VCVCVCVCVLALAVPLLSCLESPTLQPAFERGRVQSCGSG